MERANKHLILAKIESVYGTDPTPAEATEALVTAGEPTFEVINEPVQRAVPLAYFGKLSAISVGTGLKLNFSTELKGSGSAGTAPREGCLFRACNMTQTLPGGTSAVYTPNSTFEGESVTLWFWADGNLHKISGCVGTFKIPLKTREIMKVEWEFTGIYASTHITNVALPAPTYASVSPLIFKSAGFTYNSVGTLVITELMLDMGNAVSRRDSANATSGIARYFVSDRDAKGSMNPETVALTTLNPWTLFNAVTQANIAAAVSGGAGNIVTLAVTGVTLDAPKYGSRENILTWDLSFTLNPTLSAGNNEVVITFT